MKLAEMVEIQQNRKNLIGFLSCKQQVYLQDALGFEVNGLSFDDICCMVLFQYKLKLLSNRQASKCFEILANANTEFRIERYRYNDSTKDLYKYSNDCYIFVGKCSKEFYKKHCSNQYV